MSNDEKRDIEDRINDAMAKIVSDRPAGEPQPENKNNRCSCSQVGKTFEISKAKEDHRLQPIQ